MTSYKYISLIGMGAYGAVYLIETGDNDDKEYVAGKYLFNTENEGVMNPQEIAIFASFDHPNLCHGISLKNEIEEFRNRPPPGRENMVADSGFALTVWLPYATRSNLADYLNYNTISVEAKIDIMYQIMCGIEFLHHVNILHLDIKPANILVYDDPNNKVSGVCVKLTDFGSCCYTTFTKTRYFKNEIVTINVRPPENFSGCCYSQSTDVWSAGIVFFEIANQLSVYSSFEEDYIKSANKSLFNDRNHRNSIDGLFKQEKVPPGHIRDNLIDLLDKMMRYNSADRIKPDEILKHPLFAGKVKPTGTVLNSPTCIPNFDDIDVNCFIAIHRIIIYGTQCKVRTETVFLAITLFWRIYGRDNENKKQEDYSYKLTSVACFWLAYKMIEPEHLMVDNLQELSNLDKSEIIHRENTIILHLNGVLYPWNLYNYCYNKPTCIKAFTDIINPKIYYTLDIRLWLENNTVASQVEIDRPFTEFFNNTEWSKILENDNGTALSEHFYNEFLD